MINYNFIFPGQGSQSVGMSRDILISNRSKTLFNEASELIGYDLLDICLNGPEDLLIKTKNTQPSVFTLSILIDQILKESNIFPKAVAGHSLGEYAALVSSNVLKFRDALKLIILRCNEMEKANNSNDGIMAAVLNASKNDISKIINDNNENFCLVCFFKKADLIAITKSSLLTFIFPNIQKAL